MVSTSLACNYIHSTSLERRKAAADVDDILYTFKGTQGRTFQIMILKCTVCTTAPTQTWLVEDVPDRAIYRHPIFAAPDLSKVRNSAFPRGNQGRKNIRYYTQPSFLFYQENSKKRHTISHQTKNKRSCNRRLSKFD
jgi:hypothetical protein